MDEIEAHIEEGVAELEPDDEVAVRNLLDRLGIRPRSPPRRPNASAFGVRRRPGARLLH